MCIELIFCIAFSIVGVVGTLSQGFYKEALTNCIKTYDNPTLSYEYLQIKKIKPCRSMPFYFEDPSVTKLFEDLEIMEKKY